MTLPRHLADSLWIVDGPVVRWFLPFPTRMTIVRLSDGGLFVHSPIALDDALRRAVEALGQPRFLASPNKLHHLFLSQWQQTWPAALSFAPPGLAHKRADLAFQGELGSAPNPAWAQDLDQLVFRGSRVLDEVVFFHKASRTLILGDLIENFDPVSLSWFHRMVARFGGVLAPHGHTPWDFRQSFLGHRDEARQCLHRMRDWAPRRIVMCHGIPVQENAQAFLESAFAWLDH
jgi:hypothetical protein